jgi:hypothetical protein
MFSPYFYPPHLLFKETTMFTPDFYIDLLQTSKKMTTNQVYKDAVLNKACHAFIDAQSVFAKMLVKNTIDITAHSVDSYTKIFFPKEKTATA